MELNSSILGLFQLFNELMNIMTSGETGGMQYFLKLLEDRAYFTEDLLIFSKAHYGNTGVEVS